MLTKYNNIRCMGCVIYKNYFAITKIITSPNMDKPEPKKGKY